MKCFKDDLFKESEPGLAQHPFAHLALLKLLDVVDDTKLLRKFILKSLKENLEIACFDRYARKLLLHILSPRNTKYFTPSDIEMLAKIHVETENGEKSNMSRKEDSVRQSELLSDIRDALKSFCEANADKMSRSRLASDVLVETASHNMSVSSLVNAAFSISSSSSDNSDDDEDAEETILMCDRIGQRTVSRILKSENTDAFATALLNRLKEEKKNLMAWVTMQKETAFLVLSLMQKECTSKSVRKDLSLKELKKYVDACDEKNKNHGAIALVKELSK